MFCTYSTYNQFSVFSNEIAVITAQLYEHNKTSNEEADSQNTQIQLRTFVRNEICRQLDGLICSKQVHR